MSLRLFAKTHHKHLNGLQIAGRASQPNIALKRPVRPYLQSSAPVTGIHFFSKSLIWMRGEGFVACGYISPRSNPGTVSNNALDDYRVGYFDDYNLATDIILAIVGKICPISHSEGCTELCCL